MEVDMDGVRMLGIPVKLSGTPGAIRRTAPQVGQHTAELLREAGFTEQEIAAL
jgi:crotonobetainyl-CoA:carnitine CoA-transferase CaiB-like acyl-CoA transferase